MTSALSESIAYFISGVFGYHLLLALQSGVSTDSSGDVVASLVNTYFAKSLFPHKPEDNI